MAAPSYTNDLTDWIADNDTTAWGELTGAIAGGAPDEADTESSLQGTNTVSQATNTTSLFSMCRILGSPITLTSGQVFLVWHGHGVATSLLDYANGGLRLAVATTLADWKAWAVGGIDVPPFPYGKWVNNPIDPTVTAEYTNGTPPTGATNIYGVGSMGQLSAAIAKGQPHVVDIIRYGRAEARISGGDLANGYATFTGFATLNDTTTARWGLIQKTDGGYLWKGLMTLGYSSAVDFRDSNKTIFIQDTRKVSSSFNKIEVRQIGSRVDWTGITFSNLSPSTTASKGAFQMVDAADVNIDSCVFIDMDTFIFQSSATVNSSTFRRTGQITTGGAILTNCTIDRSTATSAVLAATPAGAALVSGTDFTSAGTGYAIEISGTSANMTLTGNTYTGYDSDTSSVHTGGAITGNEAIYVNIASGSPMDLNISGGTTPSVASAGVTVNVVANPITVAVTTKDVDGTVVGSVNVLLKAASGGSGILPVNATVNTITRSGTIATATHSAVHNMSTGDKVYIQGADQGVYNGVFTITVTTTTAYTYTIASDPGTDATGTLTATFVFLKDTTDAGTGVLSMSRVITANQNVTGWARKTGQPSGPFYKTAIISGTVSSAAGLSGHPLIISDE